MARSLIAALAGAALALGAAAAAPAATAPATVQIASLDQPGGSAVQLQGYWFPVAAGDAATRAPGLLMLHGCGGLHDRRGRLAARYTGLAERLNAIGVQALALDSFTPRGEQEICTQRIGRRQITQTERRRDALAALQWLAAQPGVDPARVGILGWSNGGSTVLAATNLRHAEVQAAPQKPSLAVAFYPGCDADLKRGYSAAAPLLMLLGEADDRTPAALCKALAAQAEGGNGAPVEYTAYAGAYHGFDGDAPVRLRRDVPNGVHPGAGVHVGADPAARAASAQRLEQFLRQRWKLAP